MTNRFKNSMNLFRFTLKVLNNNHQELSLLI